MRWRACRFLYAAAHEAAAMRLADSAARSGGGLRGRRCAAFGEDIWGKKNGWQFGAGELARVRRAG